MPADEEQPPILDLAIGTMLFDMAFIEDKQRVELEFKRADQDKTTTGGYAQALFFDAQVKGGWLDIPPQKYQELYRLEGGQHV